VAIIILNLDLVKNLRSSFHPMDLFSDQKYQLLESPVKYVQERYTTTDYSAKY